MTSTEHFWIQKTDSTLTGQDSDGHFYEKASIVMKRMTLKMSRGGVAPIDVGDDRNKWEESLLEEMKAAMATFSLRVSFLVEDEHKLGKSKFTSSP